MTDTDVIETQDGQNLMQIWFECGRDVFAFYDRIMGTRENIADKAGEKAGTLNFAHYEAFDEAGRQVQKEIDAFKATIGIATPLSKGNQNA